MKKKVRGKGLVQRTPFGPLQFIGATALMLLGAFILWLTYIAWPPVYVQMMNGEIPYKIFQMALSGYGSPGAITILGIMIGIGSIILCFLGRDLPPCLFFAATAGLFAFLGSEPPRSDIEFYAFVISGFITCFLGCGCGILMFILPLSISLIPIIRKVAKTRSEERSSPGTQGNPLQHGRPASKSSTGLRDENFVP